MNTETQKSPKVAGKVIELTLSEIKPYWRNPRINDQSVGGVAQSIEDYGYNQYIVVDPKNVIIVGHTRFKALTKLGWTDQPLPVIVADLPEAKAKEYRIIDNKSGEKSSWDDALLIQELRETDLKIMQSFFADNLDDLVKVSTGTNNWKDITTENFDSALLKEENKIVQLTETRQASTKEVLCPECGCEFQVV